eukprot:tig00000217_g19174.t1
MRHAQLVIGPAGSGKSTYCDQLRTHCENVRRTVHIVNLDPAAENFSYPVAFDIRDLISLDDVMSELGYGPNGGLVYCMEYLLENIDWFKEQVDEYLDDDYLVFDCPGQIELYSHLPVMRSLAENLQRWGFNVCAVCLLDSHFLSDAAKFIAGSTMCLSAMVGLALPHVNVVTKMDLLPKKLKKRIESYLDPDVPALVEELTNQTGDRFRALNSAVASLMEDYSMVQFVPLDYSDEDGLANLLVEIDNAIQYGEDAETREARESEIDQETEYTPNP